MEQTQHAPSQDYRKRLREARKAKGLTLSELAQKVQGQSLQSIGQLEREEQHATPPVIQALADALDVRIAWVISGEGLMSTRGKKQPSKKALNTQLETS